MVWSSTATHGEVRARALLEVPPATWCGSIGPFPQGRAAEISCLAPNSFFFMGTEASSAARWLLGSLQVLEFLETRIS